MVSFGNDKIKDLSSEEIDQAKIRAEKYMGDVGEMVDAIRFHANSVDTWFHCTKRYRPNGQDCDVTVFNFGSMEWTGAGGQLNFSSKESHAIQRRLTKFFMEGEDAYGWNGEGGIVVGVHFRDDWIIVR